MSDKKRILLTGASGTIGKEVLKRLVHLNDRYDVIVVNRNSRRAKKVFNEFREQAQFITADFSYLHQAERICKNIDVVIHLAAVIPPLTEEQPKLAERVNVFGTKSLIQALEKHSPHAFFIYSSSIAVYGDRLKNPEIRVGDPLQASEGDFYAETKIRAEELVQSSKLDWTIFRLSAIMGIKNHRLSKLMFYMPLKTQLEIATVEDTARALINAVEAREQLKGRIFNLGGGPSCRISYREFLERNFEIYGLGKMDFPEEAFARKNFHCGIYADGDKLNDILHFQQDSIEDYEERLRKNISKAQYWTTRALAPLIKRKILKKSEPLKALQSNNAELSGRFF
jgi:nucleoside-diphosphate-sugar epimerase